MKEYDDEGGYIQTTNLITGELLNIKRFDKDNNWIENIDSSDMDGDFGYATQGAVGDCHLLSLLKSLCDRGLDLQKAGIISWDKETGDATVRFYDESRETFKFTTDENGRIIKSERIYPEKVYTISAKELAMNKTIYGTDTGSVGDNTALALEKAFVLYKYNVDRLGQKLDDGTVLLGDGDRYGGNKKDDLIMLFGDNARLFNYGMEHPEYDEEDSWNYTTKASYFRNFNGLSFKGELNFNISSSSAITREYIKKIEDTYYIKDMNTGYWVKMFNPHAYSGKYNEEKDTVTIVNPHNLISFEVPSCVVTECFYQDFYDIPEKYLKKSA